MSSAPSANPPRAESLTFSKEVYDIAQAKKYKGLPTFLKISAKSNYALDLLRVRRLEEGVRLFTEAYHDAKRVLGLTHPMTISLQSTLAILPSQSSSI